MSYAFTSKIKKMLQNHVNIYNLLATLRQNPNQSYQALLNSLREILRDNYSQRPQLSASHPIDVHLQFVC